MTSEGDACIHGRIGKCDECQKLMDDFLRESHEDAVRRYEADPDGFLDAVKAANESEASIARAAGMEKLKRRQERAEKKAEAGFRDWLRRRFMN